MISCSSSHGRAASFFVAPRVRYLSQALFGRGLALYVVCAAGVPHATWADPEPSLWYHNGSIVYLVAKGTLREFHYKEPRLGMLDEGVRPGALLFRGQSNNNRYLGTAFIFNSRCGPLPYQVSGPVLDNSERVLLTGRAPQVGPDCSVSNYVDDVLEFRLIKQQSIDSPPEVRRPEPDPSSSLPPSATQKSIGSGVVIGTHGEVLTNAHVVENCIKITIGSSSASAASLVVRDEKNDLAVVRGDLPLSPVVAFREGKPVRAGDAVVALGYPLSGLLATTPNVSVGNVSALAGIGDDSRYLQISAPVQSGNSGGPLLDASGHLIGIVTGKLDAARIFHYFGDIPQNVNFAIKTEVVRTFLDSKGIAYQTARSEGQLSPADVGEMARPLTVQIECEQRTDADQSRPMTTLPPPDKAPRQFTMYSAVDFEGADILPWLMNSTLEACKVACGANTACQAFTFNERRNVCIIKSSYGTPKPNADAVSGSITPVTIPSIRFRVSPGVDFPGGDIDETGILGVSLDQCYAICARNSECAAFSYVQSKRWCWPKRFINFRQTNKDIISGER